MGAMARMRIGTWIVNALCGLIAYVIARWTWSGRELFAALHWELLTFLGVYLLLQLLLRGRRLAKEGKKPT
jgi:hypothetical protein